MIVLQTLAELWNAVWCFSLSHLSTRPAIFIFGLNTRADQSGLSALIMLCNWRHSYEVSIIQSAERGFVVEMEIVIFINRFVKHQHILAPYDCIGHLPVNPKTAWALWQYKLLFYLFYLFSNFFLRFVSWCHPTCLFMYVLLCPCKALWVALCLNCAAQINLLCLNITELL